MRTRSLLPAILCLCFLQVSAQQKLDSIFPVRALAIAAPSRSNLDSFVVFMQKELVSRKVNTLILRVDFNYEYKSHPELRDEGALTEKDIRKLVAAAKATGIVIIPQINLLGHQSWAEETYKLLAVYPQFDETPWVKMPAKYVWPNADSLYCKSYCSLHPGVHKIVFDLVDEICDVFQAPAFHAGMDEVFYIGDSRCPRCKGKDKAVLYADEVKRVHDHLAAKGKKLWIWGDRLLDGYSTGMGGWEASFNYTWPAIDLIPKDVVICDWHYERPDKSAVLFAAKGLSVITCAWNKPGVAEQQVHDMAGFRLGSTPEMSGRFLGVMETVGRRLHLF
ncbi:MAG TPA: family 20 glycosylhydrolase [Flavihumibacter sp.]|nr:family 20 glycosylhydrolase [Flavihumibacter sp.]